MDLVHSHHLAPVCIGSTLEMSSMLGGGHTEGCNLALLFKGLLFVTTLKLNGLGSVVLAF